MMSTQETWSTSNPVDGAFDYKVFYYNIIQIAGENSRWSRALLRWWDRQVFGNANTEEVAANAPPPEDNLMTQLLAQPDDFGSDISDVDDDIVPPADADDDNDEETGLDNE